MLLSQGLLITPLVLKVFGEESAGIWFLILQFTAFIGLFELGLPTALSRIYAKLNKKSPHRIQHVSFLGLGLLTVVSFLLLVSHEYLATLFFNLFPGVPNEIHNENLLMFGVLSVIFSLPLRTGLGALEGSHFFYIHLAIESTIIFLRLLLLYLLFFFFRLDANLFGYIYFSFFLLIPLLQFIFCLYNKYIILSLRVASFSYKEFKYLISIGFSVMLVTAAATIIRQGSSLIIGTTGDLDSVTIFSISILLLTLTQQFITIPVSLLGPRISELSSQDDFHDMHNLIVSFSTYSLSLGTVFCGTFYLLGQLFLDLWLNLKEESLIEVFNITLLLICTFCLTIPALFLRTALSFSDKHFQASYSEIFAVVLGILIGCFNVFILNLGVLGMAIGISFVFLARILGPILFFYKSLVNQSIIRIFNDIYSKNLSILFLLTAFYFIFNEYLNIYTILLIILLFFMMQFTFVVKSEHKHFVYKYLKK